jgi:hypothetical protein
MYQVYQLGENASVTLNLLSLGYGKKKSGIMSISLLDMCFILKSIFRVDRHIIVMFI